jgi:hypothetical protein
MSPDFPERREVVVKDMVTAVLPGDNYAPIYSHLQWSNYICTMCQALGRVHNAWRRGTKINQMENLSSRYLKYWRKQPCIKLSICELRTS